MNEVDEDCLERLLEMTDAEFIRYVEIVQALNDTLFEAIKIRMGQIGGGH